MKSKIVVLEVHQMRVWHIGLTGFEMSLCKKHCVRNDKQEHNKTHKFEICPNHWQPRTIVMLDN